MVEHSLNFGPQLPLGLLLLAADGCHLSDDALERLGTSMRFYEEVRHGIKDSIGQLAGIPNLHALHLGRLVEIVCLMLEQRRLQCLDLLYDAYDLSQVSKRTNHVQILDLGRFRNALLL
jgi:hypothetical protein